MARSHGRSQRVAGESDSASISKTGPARLRAGSRIGSDSVAHWQPPSQPHSEAGRRLIPAESHDSDAPLSDRRDGGRNTGMAALVAGPGVTMTGPAAGPGPIMSVVPVRVATVTVPSEPPAP